MASSMKYTLLFQTKLNNFFLDDSLRSTSKLKLKWSLMVLFKIAHISSKIFLKVKKLFELEFTKNKREVINLLQQKFSLVKNLAHIIISSSL